MRFGRLVLLALFAAGQTVIATHAHAFGVPRSSKGACVREAVAPGEVCRICEFASVARFGSANAAVVAPIFHVAFAGVPAVEKAVVSSTPVSFSARAPPAR